MKCKLLILIGVLLLAFAMHSYAAAEQYPFTNEQQRNNFSELMHELRCLVCQNQDLADSNASLAIDLRGKIYQMLLQGKSKQEVLDYMTARYGDFVLYKPPFKASTYVLWIGPFLLLIVALVLVVIIVKRRHDQTQTDEVNS